MRFVLDASVTMSWLLADGKPSSRSYAQVVLEAMKQPETQAEVPVTWGLEVANVIGRAEAKGFVLEAQSNAFLEMLSGVPIVADRATFSRALGETLNVARRYRLSSYDASYLELALRAGIPIATLDDGLAKAAKRAGVKRFRGA